jgi:hypothetical protein
MEKGALFPGTEKMKGSGHFAFSRPFLSLNEDRKPGGGESKNPFPFFSGNPGGMKPAFDPLLLREPIQGTLPDLSPFPRGRVIGRWPDFAFG